VQHGIRRAMNVILQGDGKPFGVLEVDSRSEDEFVPHDLAFLQGAANILGMAIERERQERSLKAALARQQVHRSPSTRVATEAPFASARGSVGNLPLRVDGNVEAWGPHAHRRSIRGIEPSIQPMRLASLGATASTSGDARAEVSPGTHRACHFLGQPHPARGLAPSVCAAPTPASLGLGPTPSGGFAHGRCSGTLIKESNVARSEVELSHLLLGQVLIRQFGYRIWRNALPNL
jgi:GAF domain